MPNPSKNSPVQTLSEIAPPGTCPIGPEELTRHAKLPDTVVDRDGFISAVGRLEESGGLLVVLVLDDLTALPESVTGGSASKEWDHESTRRVAARLAKWCSSRGIKLPEAAVGISLVRLSPEAEAAHLVQARLALYEHGRAVVGGNSLALEASNPDGLLAAVGDARMSVLALYDLRKLVKEGATPSGTVPRYTPPAGSSLAKAFLGDIVLVEGGSAALQAGLLRYGESLPLTSSAASIALKALEKDGEELARTRRSLSGPDSSPQNSRILEEIRLREMLNDAARTAIAAGTIPSSLVPTLKELVDRHDLLRDNIRRTNSEWEPDRLCSGTDHPGVPMDHVPSLWVENIPTEPGDTCAALSWFTEQYARAITDSKDPLDLLVKVIFTMRHFQGQLGLQVPTLSDLPALEFDAAKLSTESELSAAKGTLGLSAEADRSEDDPGQATFLIGIPVIRYATGTYPCDCRVDAQRELVRAAAYHLIEELTHLEQTAKVTAVPMGDRTYESHCVSDLALRYFAQHPPSDEEDSALWAKRVEEIDALGRQVEFARAGYIPWEAVREELFEYHFDVRWRFTKWLIDENLIPTKHIPEFMTDDAQLARRVADAERDAEET